MIINVNKKDVMQLTGYSQTQSQNLIRLAKENMVKEGFSWYKSKGVGRVPIIAIEEILGFSILESDKIKDVKKWDSNSESR